MIQHLRRHKFAAVIPAFVLLTAFCLFRTRFAEVRGRLAAHIDVARGQYQVLGYGLELPSRSEYAHCLQERYHIEFKTVAGCIVSDSLVSYAKGYHAVVTDAANRKFGHDVFKECAEEADQKWKASDIRHVFAGTTTGLP
jgi:hypothetical protein